jgi:hypothetical protein
MAQKDQGRNHTKKEHIQITDTRNEEGDHTKNTPE